MRADERIEPEGLDDYDQARASDMDERPIYVTISVTLLVQPATTSRTPAGKAVVA